MLELSGAVSAQGEAQQATKSAAEKLQRQSSLRTVEVREELARRPWNAQLAEV